MYMTCEYWRTCKTSNTVTKAVKTINLEVTAMFSHYCCGTNGSARKFR
jgi:hypothetical protein